MAAVARSVWEGLLDALYPPRCLVCGRDEAEPFCAACRSGIVPLAAPFCDRCGVPVPAGRLVCETCAEGEVPAFAWSQAVGQYTGTLRTAIHRLKYDRRTALAKPLGELLAAAIKTGSPLLPEGEPFDCIVPVPLHRSKLRTRGFNQAELVARVLVGRCGCLLDTKGLLRVLRTRTQTAYHAAERLSNVAQVFDTATPLYFDGKSILLVDDVLTTGSTVRECSRVLQNAGARRVAVLVVARGL